MIRLIFSVDTRFEGANHILKTLKSQKIKGSFFLTGNALRNQEFKKTIQRIIKDGHYLGGHSDDHLLYASWGERETLVTDDSLLIDLRKNIGELQKWGVSKEQTKFYLPPYEWYNKENVDAIENFGMEVINFSSGLRTAADYTTPDMKNYMSSQELIDQLYLVEKEKTLNGAIILIHPGTVPERTDKLYNRLQEIIVYLKDKGYMFEKF